MTTMAPALQALAVVAAAVALQQYSSITRTRRLAAKAKQQQQIAAAKAVATPTQQQRDDSTEAFVVEIEYCTGCRWMLRAAWLAQELLTTFQSDLHAVKLVPNSHEGGVFQVYVYDEHAADERSEKELLWSRKLAGRFPESKELKQIVRDFVKPDKGLGHSDKK